MRIILSAIVGNEEKVIERFVRSFAPAVEAFVFVRAIGDSEPDGTFDIARQTALELGKECHWLVYSNKAPGLPHVDDFAAARQMSLEAASRIYSDKVITSVEGEKTWILWADCDDLLADGAADALREAAGKDCDLILAPYHIHGGKQIVWRERMVRNSGFASWKFPVHEMMAFSRDVSYSQASGAVFLHQPLLEKTGSTDRNLAILAGQTRDTARNHFYIAQELFGHDDQAFKEAATIALSCKNLETQERYELLLKLAQTKGEDSKRHALDAYYIMPDRREALALLCNYALIDGKPENAMQISWAMQMLDEPKKAYWTLNHEWYGWKGEELVRQCMRLTGKGAEADDDQQASVDQTRPVFSIIHATLGRPEKALAIRELWLSAAKYPQNVDYVFGLHHDDAKSVKWLSGFRHTVTERKGSASNYDTAAGIAFGDVLVQAQDDCYPPLHWDVALAEIIGNVEKPVFVAAGDGHRTDRLSVNSIMTRPYMELKASMEEGENGFFHRGYTTVYCDTENSVRAIQDGRSGLCRYIDAREFVIYHDHPMFNPKMPWDETYEWENSPENYKAGEALFHARNPNTKGLLER